MNKLLILLALSLLTLMVNAQSDFSGKWKLNKDKSTLNQDFSMAPSEIIIIQSKDTIKVERHSNFQGNDFTIKDKYSLDGKECINDGMMDTKKKSTAVFSSKKDSLTVVSKIPMQDGADMVIKEIYLLRDGNFILNSSSSSSFGDMKEKMVYDKQ
jgi:hypothetical protein